jgi:hypothetical protein
MSRSDANLRRSEQFVLSIAGLRRYCEIDLPTRRLRPPKPLSLQLGGSLIPFTKLHARGNEALIVAHDAAHDLDRAERTRRRCVSPLAVAVRGSQTIAWSGFAEELLLAEPTTLIARGEAW